ncbi:hypothetical protein POM88_047875 [Heracleum sosnowskyi]|uniref:F-box domain-containing protein n=1 Tax=Heracleum sosnowskyi TaxID=360622 RepID=A0AAD8LZZ6_9APIA|nr:hypothetical protein POM88_047875 [Heracleum sosnowskyi]
MATTTSNCYMPEDIMFNLLSWLPVKSLVRFKSVCKLWLSITSHPKFIETHLTNSKKREAEIPSSALVVEKDVIKPSKFYLVESSKDRVMLQLPPQLDHHMILFVNSCNGLVCLANSDCNVLCLWNPSTKWYKKIPAPNKRFSCYPSSMGFGFDSTSNDYKILRILIYPNAVDNDSCMCTLEADMYSSNADSWKEIQPPKKLQNFSCCKFSRVHTINEVLYLHYIDGLLSFDLHNEVFELYPFPYSLPYTRRKSCLLDFEGSAAMVFSESVRDESVLSLWTLDYVCGEVLSRTKKFNLELDCKMHYRVISYLGVGQFVVKDDSGVYSVYDNKKKERRNLAWVMEDASFFKYTGSLVSLQGSGQQE